MRRLVDQGAPPQLVKRQRRVDPAGGVEVAVYQPVEDMTNVKPPRPSSSIRVADDVDRAAVAQQVIELRPIGELIDPGEKREAMGAKPSPTSGRVSIEMLNGSALSKMKLRNVCATSPSLQ